MRGCGGTAARLPGSFLPLQELSLAGPGSVPSRYRVYSEPVHEFFPAGTGVVQSRFMGFPLPVQGTVCVGVFPDVEPDALRQ